MKKISTLLLLLLITTTVESYSQNTLTLQEIIEIVLKNNYSIQIAKNDNTISSNNNSIGNAGMLPTVNFNASGTWASNDTKQKFATGTEIDRKDAVSIGNAAGIALNWVLFDGMKMFATNDKLKLQFELSTISLKSEIERTITELMINYYSIIRQKEIIAAIENSMSLYEERINISKTKWEIGSASKLDYLQAQIDMNVQKSNLLKQKKILRELKVSMNKLLAKSNINEDFDIKDEIKNTYNPSYEELNGSYTKNNTQLQWQQKNILVNNYLLKENNAARFPKIWLNTAYNFSYLNNQAGFILFNQNAGFNAGFTASWTLFNGTNTNTQIKNQKLTLINAQLQYEQTKKNIETELLNAYYELKNTLELLKLEEENLKLTEENLKIAFERFKIGTSTGLELKEIQKSHEDAQLRVVNTKYDAKIAETQLMRLNGMLVKQY